MSISVISGIFSTLTIIGQLLILAVVVCFIARRFFLQRERVIFLRGRPPLCGGWRRVSVGLVSWIYGLNSAK